MVRSIGSYHRARGLWIWAGGVRAAAIGPVDWVCRLFCEMLQTRQFDVSGIGKLRLRGCSFDGGIDQDATEQAARGVQQAAMADSFRPPGTAPSMDDGEPAGRDQLLPRPALSSNVPLACSVEQMFFRVKGQRAGGGVGLPEMWRLAEIRRFGRFWTVSYESGVHSRGCRGTPPRPDLLPPREEGLFGLGRAFPWNQPDSVSGRAVQAVGCGHRRTRTIRATTMAERRQDDGTTRSDGALFKDASSGRRLERGVQRAQGSSLGSNDRRS